MEYMLSLIAPWNLARGRTPHIRKRLTIKYYSNKYKTRTFVETGTYLGDMISAMSRHFTEIHSIELFRPLYEKARVRFAGKDNIHLYFGDSSTGLAYILTKIKSPAVFWLDAHYSGGNTAQGTKKTPILKELDQIFKHSVKEHIILIDDASDFTGLDDYPRIEQIENYVKQSMPGYTVLVKDNMIHIIPLATN